VIGVRRQVMHTAVWTEEGELFTFGHGYVGRLGHGGYQEERVPRLVEALVGKKVIGAAAGDNHTAVWTATGELFALGRGGSGHLGHGGQEHERVPRLCVCDI
jgi:alpha-tubulin suppressor-like RCC1 family protein